MQQPSTSFTPTTNVYRLTNTQRGTLSFNPLSITATKYQDWTLDGLGNFAEFDDNGASQTRDVNAANEITSTTGIATPTYDAAGNIVSDGTLKYQYDAWNRQTVVRRVSDNSLVATYAYDGQNRRVTKTLAGGTATDCFYNRQWQLVEERTLSGPTTTVDQYVWDQSYVDSPIVRFHDGNGDGDCDPDGDPDENDSADTIRYYAGDANHNVTTTITVGHTSTAVQHVAYDAYGKAKVYAADWTGSADPTESGPLYCGYFFDVETGNYLARNRYYTIALATWLSRDPIVYEAKEFNLYRYVHDNPLTYTDPTGLWELRCRRLLGGGKAAWSARHCWIVCDGHSYSLLNNDGIATPIVDDDRDGITNGYLVASGPGKCKCIKANFEHNKQTYPYDYSDCNSNWYAHQLLDACDIYLGQYQSFDPPYGAVGWNDCKREKKPFKPYTPWSLRQPCVPDDNSSFWMKDAWREAPPGRYTMFRRSRCDQSPINPVCPRK